MAARTRTLQQLLDGVARRADLNIADTGVRHTTALVTADINKACQKWIRMVAEAGDDTNMLTVRTATATSTTRDAKNWAPNQYIAQPAGLMFVRGIDIWSGNTPLAMMDVAELERNDSQLALSWWNTGGTGLPIFYRLGGTNNAGNLLIQIFPWADAVYTVDIRYIPNLTDFNEATPDVNATMEFILGGEDWVEIETAMRALRSDGLAGTAEFADMRAEKREIEASLAFALAGRASPRKVDTVERRRLLRQLSAGPWRLL